MPLLKKEQHRQVYLLGIILLAASVPLSRYFMSVSQFILLGNWLLEGNVLEKCKRFWKNKPAVVFSSLYLLHFIGLFFTTDFDYAVKDLRTKVPLLLLPLFFSSSESLNQKELRIILYAYLAAVLSGTLTGILILLQQTVPDTREMSPFISHIRFSLNVCMAGVVILFLLKEDADRKVLKRTILGILFCWFIAYLYISQSFTGYFILASLLIAWLISWGISTSRKFLRWCLILVIVMIPFLLYSYFLREYHRFFYAGNQDQNQKLTWVTPSYHWYSHDTSNREVISGHRVWLYISKEEMRSMWNKRSNIPYDSYSNNGLKIEDVLIRFLTSKGSRKDSTGVNDLTEKEIQDIEHGIADVEETRGSPLHKRLRKIFWEYQNYLSTGDPSGHSVMMRLEYWKASIGLIAENPLTGVGTGDMNQAFNRYYSQHHSKLKPEWRRRSHNQYLSIMVGFGIPGLLWFLLALFYAPLKSGRLTNFMFGSFFLILLLSMIPEDTLESQEGVTFAAFFFSLLLFAVKEKEITFD